MNIQVFKHCAVRYFMNRLLNYRVYGYKEYIIIYGYKECIVTGENADNLMFSRENI